MRFWPFVIWTFVGSLPWCYALSYGGFKLRENWAAIEPWFHRFDVVIGATIVVCAVVWIRHHIGALRESHPGQETPPPQRKMELHGQ